MNKHIVKHIVKHSFIVSFLVPWFPSKSGLIHKHRETYRETYRSRGSYTCEGSKIVGSEGAPSLVGVVGGDCGRVVDCFPLREKLVPVVRGWGVQGLKTEESRPDILLGNRINSCREMCTIDSRDYSFLHTVKQSISSLFE